MTQLFELSQWKIKRKLLTTIQENMENPYITYESHIYLQIKIQEWISCS
jgi:hypothetical protein